MISVDPLTRYLQLEGRLALRDALGLDDAACDDALCEMDDLWQELSEADRAWLDARGARP